MNAIHEDNDDDDDDDEDNNNNNSNDDNVDDDGADADGLMKISVYDNRIDHLNVLQAKCPNKDFMECDIEHCSNMLNFNKQITSSLLNLKQHLTFALEKCERKLMTIERSLQRYMVGETKVLICNAGIPYFKDRHYFFASNNEDEILKEKRKELQLRNLPKVCSWTETERDKLLKAVREEVIAKASILCNQSIGCTKVNDSTFRLKGKREAGTDEFLSTNFLDNLLDSVQEKQLDWYKISSLHFEDTHSPLDCHVMWNVFLRPDINKLDWTRSEDGKLKQIAEKYKFQNWDRIGKELRTNRTAYQCFIRYNTKKKLPKIRNCSWNHEEDERLLIVIEIFRIGDFIPWGEVGSWMHNRTKQQAYFRWTYSLAPYLTKGRFTKTEDNILIDAVTKYGRNFRKISAILMPNRSTVQLHDRYQTLTINQTENLWTLEDDTKLLNLFRRIGPNWSAIAKQFAYKTRTQLRHRHTALKKYIARDISLFQLHKHRFYNENKIAEQQQQQQQQHLRVEYTKDPLFRFKNNATDKTFEENDIDKQLIDYFHIKYKVEKFTHEWEWERERERITINLYNILRVLNANLCLPDKNDIVYMKLSNGDRQLSYSLREHIRSRSDEKRRSRVINNYQLRMFPTDQSNENNSHFIPPLPFDSQIKFKRSNESQSIDYNLNVKNNFLLEAPTDFDTPNLVVSYIGGNDQQLQFQKITNLVRVNRFENEHSSTLSRNALLHRSTAYTNDRTNSHRFRLASSPTEISKQCDLRITYATRATLFSFKNLIYLKRLTEKYRKSEEFCIQSNMFHQAFGLLETRLEKLFKYPIGLSKIVLPEVYVIDTFSSNDANVSVSKRKPSEISNILEKHQAKKLRTVANQTID